MTHASGQICTKYVSLGKELNLSEVVSLALVRVVMPSLAVWGSAEYVAEGLRSGQPGPLGGLVQDQVLKGGSLGKWRGNKLTG